jgi:hypothetical protein
MNDQEIIEMNKRKLARPDFTDMDKRAFKTVIRAHMEKMGDNTCAAATLCIEPGIHEYMPGIWVCGPHHKKGYAVAVSARCSKCPAWVVLNGRTTNPEPAVYEFTCPVESCKTSARIRNSETKGWTLPNTLIDRGYFYERDLEGLA